jgi:hypothetical protein
MNPIVASLLLQIAIVQALINFLTERNDPYLELKNAVRRNNDANYVLFCSYLHLQTRRNNRHS